MTARLEAAGHYVHWGVVQISLTNLLIIVAMVLLFAAALLVPFPASREQDEPDAAAETGRAGTAPAGADPGRAL